MIGASASPSWPSAVSPRQATTQRAFGSTAICARWTRCGRCPGLWRSLASGSVRDIELALLLRRLGVGPDRGSTKASGARDPCRPPSPPPSPPASASASALGVGVGARQLLAAGAVLDRPEARAQTGQRRIGLDVKAIDRQIRAID